MELSKKQQLDNVINNTCTQVFTCKNLYEIGSIYNNAVNIFNIPISKYTSDSVLLILLRILNDLKNTDCSNVDYKTLFMIFSLLSKYHKTRDSYSEYDNKTYVYKKDDIRYILFTMYYSRQNYFVYNLMDDEDDIVLLPQCENIKNFDLDFKNIKSFNIPRLIISKEYYNPLNKFNGQFKNILNILYYLIYSNFFCKYIPSNSVKTNIIDHLTSIYHIYTSSYTDIMFKTTVPQFKIKQKPENISYYHTKFEKSKRLKIGSEKCASIYLEFLSSLSN